MDQFKSLVAIDFSEDSFTVLKRVMEFTQKIGGTVDVVHIVENSFFSPKKDIKYIKEHSLEKLKHTFANFDEKHFHCVEGNTKKEIAKIANILKSKLIIIGKSGETYSFSEVYLGSHTKHIVRSADVPVLVLKKDSEIITNTILLPTDLSSASAQVILKIAKLFPNAYLTLVHFFTIPFEARLNSYGFSDEDTIEYMSVMKEQSEKNLEKFIQTIDIPHGFAISSKVRKSSLNPKLFDKEVEDIPHDILALHTTGKISFYAFDILESSIENVLILKV
ncbi:MAG: universal stress protein [Sulfurimonas sp.]|uniref:universal stress protein n=1 Tax=Sulfurimonas sp. TaxID=2022749 RepID=UPI0025CF393F|nr:universal stress protein [Sulfurimonas sp.]MCK9490608.1 universal stress protein [Sulfurimonas sp.]